MAEDLSIKVKVEPDVSDLPKKLSTAGANLAPIPVDIKLDNLGDVRGQIAALGASIDVKINPVIAGGSIGSAVQNSMKGQKINLDMFDMSKVTQELKNVSDAMTQVANKVTAAFKTKVDTTMKATAGNIAGLSKTFGTIEKRIKGVNDAASKSQLESQYKTLKSQWDGLITSGVMSTEQFSGMAKELSMLQREVIAVGQAEKEIAGLPNSINAAVGSLNALETSFKNTLGLKYGALDLTESKAVLQDIDALRAGLASMNGDKKSLELFLDNWRSKAAAVGVDMKGLGDIMKFVSAEIATATKSGNEWNKMAQEEANVAKAQADAVDKLIAKAKQVTDARSKLDLTGLTGNKDVDNALTAYNDQRFITRNSRSLAENHQDNAQYVKDYQDNVEKLENLFYDLANAAKVAGKQVESVLDLSDVKQKLNDALNRQTDTGESTTQVENLRGNVISLLDDINKAEQAFNVDWNVDTFKTLIDLLAQGEPLANKLGNAIGRINEKHDDNLQKQLTQLKDSIVELKDVSANLQLDSGIINSSGTGEFEETKNTISNIKTIVDLMSQVASDDSFDYTQVTDFLKVLQKYEPGIKSIGDAIDYVKNTAKTTSSAIEKLGSSMKDAANTDSLFGILGEYSQFKNSHTVKSKIQDLYAKAVQQKSDVDTAKANMLSDDSAENVKTYEKAVSELTVTVKQLRTEMNNVKFGDADFLSGQFADKEKTIATLQSLLDKFNADVGAAGGLSSSKAFAGDLKDVIDELNKVGSAFDLGNLFKNAGTQFDGIRSKAYSVGESFDTLASIVSYFKKAMAEANNEASNYNAVQEKLANAAKVQNSAWNFDTDYKTFTSNYAPSAEIQGLAKEIEDMRIKARQAETELQVLWSDEKLEAYLKLIDSLDTKLNQLSAKIRSFKFSQSDKNVQQTTQQLEQLKNLPGMLERAERTLYKQAGKKGAQNIPEFKQAIQFINDLKTEAYKALDSNDQSGLTNLFASIAKEAQEAHVNVENLNNVVSVLQHMLNKTGVKIDLFNGAKLDDRNINSWMKSINNTIYTAQRYLDTNSKIKQSPELYAKFQNFLEPYKEMIDKGLVTNENGQEVANQITSDWSEVKRAIQEAGYETDTFGEKMKKLFEVNIKSQLANQIINGVQQGLRQVYQNVVDIDSAMTELKKVTDESSSTYDKFLTEAGERAKNVGSTVSDIINATADYSRLGYNLEDSKTLADVSAIYYNVGDDLDSFSTATDNIVGTMKAFNMQADEAIDLVDKLDNVSNNYAVSSGDLGDILQRSASAMEAAGNTLDQTIALGTAMNSVLQSADTTGTTLKVLALRLRGASTELKSMGEETDGVATSTSKLRAQIAALTNVDGTGGFDILTDSGSFKSTYDIIQGIAKVYERMSDVDQASLLELIAGKNRANGVAALLKQASQAEDVLNTSLNSSGAALKENQRVLDSIEGKIKRFTATFQSFSSDLLDSKLVKCVIDLGTAAMNTADNFVKMGETLPAIAAGISGIVTGMGGTGGVNMPFYAVGIAT
nr:MAG TPA: minor tail protein [Caudoviricetes sp.]